MFNSGFIAYLGQRKPRSSFEIQAELDALNDRSRELNIEILASLALMRSLLNQRLTAR